MAIFDYDTTINNIAEFSLDFNEDIDYINEAGLGIEHTSGFYSLSTKLIALAKKIGGKVTKKKNYTSKSIKYQIERNKELRDKYYEELKLLKDNNYKIKPSMVAKWFFGLYINTMTTTTIDVIIAELAVSPLIYAVNVYSGKQANEISHSFNKKYGHTFDDIDVNKYAIHNTKRDIINAVVSISKITAIIIAIVSAGMTTAVLTDYKKSLNNGIKQLDDNIKHLNDSYDKMVKIENSKNK